MFECDVSKLNINMEGCSDIQDKKRYLSLNDKDRDNLIDSVIPKNTKNSTKQWMNAFSTYVKEKKDCKFS